MATIAQQPSDSAAPPADNRRWWALGVIAICQLMLVLDGSIVTIALPEAGRELSLDDSQIAWIVASYMLAFGAFLLLGGRIGDYLGRRRALFVGLVGFAGVSLLGAVATNAAMLIAARFGQGVFGALMAPASLALLTVTFTEPRERARAFAVFGAISGGGMAVGLILGGILTELGSWRWTLAVNVPVALVALVLGLRVLPESRASGPRRYDVPGALLSAIGLGVLVYGLSIAGESDKGWAAPETLVLVTAGIALLVAFVVWEARAAAPLLPLRVIGDRQRGGSFLILLLLNLSISALFFFLTFYFQGARNYTPLETGLAFLPFALGLFGMSYVTPRLLLRFGARTMIVTGAAMAALGMLLLSSLQLNTPLWLMMAAQGIIGVGMSLAFIPLASAALSGVDEDDAGVASALVNTVGFVGASLGIALLNATAASVTACYLLENPDALPDAQISGYARAFLVSAALMLVAAILGYLMIDKTQVSTEQNAAPAHLG